MAKTITQLPAGTAQGTSVVAVDNPTGTATEKVTLASIAAIGGGIPGSHAARHASSGSDPIAPGDIGAATATHIHDASAITSGTFGDAMLPATVVRTTDSRLTDARAPTAHSHAAGDIVSGTMASARLGTGVANAASFLRGDGVWASPHAVTATDLTMSLAGTPVVQLAVGAAFVKGRMFAEGNNDPFSVGARFNSSGGAVYFGAADATDTPSAQISNKSGTALMTLTNAGAVTIPGSLSVGGSAVVVSTDSRLTNARAPTAHNHSATEITSGTLPDARLSSNVPLLVGGLLPSNVLPSFVDDVLEYSALASFPATGSSGVIYVDTTSTKIYRWSGSVYIEISPSPGSTTDVAEGTNLYFTSARASAAAPVQSVNSKVGAVALTASDVGAAATSHNHAASTITSGVFAPARLGTGTADSTTFLRGDGTWQVGTGGSGSGISVADADVRYVNVAGDSMTGGLTVDGTLQVGTAALSDSLRYLDIHNGGTGAGSGSILRLVTQNVAGTGNVPVNLVKYKNGLFSITNADTNAAACIVLQVGGTEGVRLTSSGNVGIGTSSPAALLHVSDTAAAAQILVTSANTSTGAVLFGDTDSNLNAGRIQYNHAFDVLQLFANNGERIRVLDVGLWVYPDGTAAQPSIAHGDDTNTGLWFPAADTIAVSTGGVERMRVDTAVRITGVASSTALSVAGAGNANLNIDYLGGGFNYHDATQHVFRNGDGARGYVSISDRTLVTANDERFAIGARYNSTGNYVYFGATDATSGPGMQISNAGGGAMISCTNAGAVSIPGSLSVAGNAAVVTTDARLTDARTPLSHVHGNISNAGAIGTASGLPIITTAGGVLTVGAFGTSAGSFCQGNDSRLSDARQPLAHNQAASTITGLATVATSGNYNDLTNKPAASTGRTFGSILALS